MILIDKPYVSDFLIKTIKKNKFQIVSTSIARSLILDDSLNWISEKKAINILNENPNTPIYSNSENAINWVNTNLSSSKLPTQIQIFKNKIQFRELIKEAFPNYFFKGVEFNDLDNLSLESLEFPFIIKPAVGFFSVGVHKVDKPSEWPSILKKIKFEIAEVKGLYPDEVINTSQFIIEEYIEGEEYAVDCYFNKKGEVIVLNILHHIFSSGKDVSDRVYTTSKEIIENHIHKVESFLNTIGAKTNLKNFPIHVEIRIDKNGEIIPIEVNPLRFGGWCTTGDLSWYAHGINSYEYFLYEKKPNWNKILKTKINKKYSIIVLDNNSKYKETEIDYFDYEKLLSDFEKPIILRKIDFNKYPLFGFLFTETSFGNEKEINQILTSNLKKYLKIIN